GGEKMMRDCAERSSNHGADEKRRAEDAARVSGGITGGHGDELEDDEHEHQFERYVPIQGITDIAIAHAENLRDEPSGYTHKNSADDRMEPGRFRRKAQETGAHGEQKFGESDGSEAAGDTE